MNNNQTEGNFVYSPETQNPAISPNSSSTENNMTIDSNNTVSTNELLTPQFFGENEPKNEFNSINPTPTINTLEPTMDIPAPQNQNDVSTENLFANKPKFFTESNNNTNNNLDIQNDNNSGLVFSQNPQNNTADNLNNNPINEDNTVQDSNNLTGLNVSGDYNNLNNTNNGPIPYASEPQVMANMEKIKKKTVNIPATPELKTIIILAIVLLVFIIVMPFVFDLLRNISG